ncbi:MAG TPA: ATP-binding cassette domain-containing protein [Hyphomicrobium sp.]
MIVLEHVSKSFDGGKTFALRDVSLTIDQGETFVLLGSSGSGKTTILRLISRLIEPTAGTIALDGRDLRDYTEIALRRNMGYVFQGIGLFPHMTVAQNVAIGLRLIGEPLPQREARARELLELVELQPDAFLHRFPAELSGGQQQRVAVARALATNPDYLLMDEPFGALDALTREALQAEVLRLKAKLAKTIVFVTHDIVEAFLLGDRIGVCNAGRLEQVGTRRDLLASPKTDFVRALLARPLQQLEAFRELQ